MKWVFFTPGIPNPPRPRTSAGLRPVRNRAAEQEESGRRASKASFAAPHCSPSLTLLPEPSPPSLALQTEPFPCSLLSTPTPVCGKIVCRETGPWYQKGWGLLLYPIFLNCGKIHMKFIILKYTVECYLVQSQCCAAITPIQFQNIFITPKGNPGPSK